MGIPSHKRNMADQLKILMVSLLIAGFFTVKDLFISNENSETSGDDLKDMDTGYAVPTLKFMICIG